MRRLSRRNLLLWAAVGAIASGCISPTLPLPPPSPPDIEALGQGQYRLTGVIPVQGTVLIQNARTKLVYGQSDAYTYSFVVQARDGDYMNLWYEVSEVESDSTTFQIDVPDVAPPDGGKETAKDAGPDSH